MYFNDWFARFKKAINNSFSYSLKKFLAVIILYFIGAKFGYSWAELDPAVSPFWPPTGIMLALAILWGPRYLVAVFTGAILTSYFNNTDLAAAFFLATGSTVEIFVALKIFHLLEKNERLFGFHSEAIGLSIGAFFGSILSAFISIYSLINLNQSNPEKYWELWTSLWIGTFSSAITITPFVLYISRPENYRKKLNSVALKMGAFIKSTVCLASVAASFWLVKQEGFNNWIFVCYFLLLINIILIGELGAYLYLISILCFGIYKHMYVQDLTPALTNESLIYFQLNIVGLSLSSLFIRGFKTINELKTATIALSLSWLISGAAMQLPGLNLNTSNIAVMSEVALVFAIMSLLVASLLTSFATTARRAEYLADKQTQLLKSKEATLRESEKRFALAVEGSNDGIWDWNLSTNEIYFSSRWKEILGFKDSEIENKVSIWKNQIHKEDSELVSSTIQSYLEGKLPECHIEYRLQHKDKSWRWVLSRAKALRDINGKPYRLSGSITDITDIKNHQASLITAQNAAIEAAKSKSQFLARMSHEVRTPINGIIGIISLLQETTLNQDQKDLLHTLSKSSENLLSIVNGILDFSKLEAGKFEVEKINFNLPELVKDTVDIFRPAAKAKNINLEYHLDLKSSGTYLSDPVKIRQVLTNLIGNAIKFTPKGSVQLNITEKPLANTSSHLEFYVEDTGIGMSSEVQKMIFEPFVQADLSTTRRFGGTGLGLSICKGLVNMLSGEIGVESRQGRGTTFWFYLNLDVPTKQEKINSNEEEGIDYLTMPKLKILLVEDNAVNLKVATKILEKMGQSVEASLNGVEAFRKSNNKEFDIIFMDCHMPDMDGYEATKRIRSLADSKNKTTPIIAVTANALQGDREKCLASGMDDYLIKPIRKQTLAKMILKWSKKSKLSQKAS